MRFATNFVSAAFAAPSVEALTVTRPNASASRIAAINAEFAAAQRAQSRGAYVRAIRSYKRCRSLIYAMLHPRHSIGRHVAFDDLVLPVGRAYETKIAEASLKLIEASRSALPAGTAPVRVFGAPIDEAFAGDDEVGVVRGGPVRERVRITTTQAVGLLAEGETAQATELLMVARDQLGGATTEEARDAAAAIDLNLSSALLDGGDAGQALASAESAETRFAEAGDAVGAAQAQHNQAVALRRLGREDEAAQRSAAATMSLGRARETAGAVRPAVRPEALAAGRTADPRTTRLLGARLRRPTLATPLAGGEATVGEVVAEPTTELGDLDFIEHQAGDIVALRWPGAGEGWEAVRLRHPVAARRSRESWSLGVQIGEKVTGIDWTDGRRPAGDTLDRALAVRRDARTIAELRWVIRDLAESAAYLPHLYGFVIPQALGDCYHASGNFARAENYYLQAARYTHINAALEVPALWARLARNALRWGDRLYKAERIDACMAVYAKLVTREGAAPAESPLYDLAVFERPAADARRVIADLDDPTAAGVNPAIAMPVVVAWSRWQYLLAGLDFFGTAFTPVFTFEYLQQVALGFADQAIQAEREYVNFQVQAEAEAATRRDLEGAVALAEKETEIRRENRRAAHDERRASEHSAALARRRADNAAEERDTYARTGYDQYVYQSIATAHGAGADWYGDEIRRLAADMEAGSWEGKHGKLAAAATLLAGQASYEYQMTRLGNDAQEMAAMIPVAEAQARAAAHRERAAALAVAAAQLREDLTRDALEAFEEEMFTPELWERMAEAMQELSESYKEWAIRVAKLAERAFNFETDSALRLIKSEYPAAATGGLLGADYLKRDIDSFTYHAIAYTRQKETDVKDVISLRNEYPFLFYELQRTGRMTFETMLHDFDRKHPGLCGQRIRAVEIEVVGLLPPEGVQGTLRGGGLSRYRRADGGERTRIHGVDTMALSEYTVRHDAFIYRQDARIHGLFEGQGVASSWDLSLPRRSNNFDYRLLTDVRLVLYYAAVYEPDLAAAVLQRPPLPGEMIHTRDFLLRYDFPESWYGLLDTGETTLTLGPEHLPRNETDFTTDKVSLALLPEPGIDAGGIALTLTPPGQAAVNLVTGAEGRVATTEGSALAGVMGGALLGGWRLTLDAPADRPLRDGEDRLRLAQIAVIVQYGFAYPDEA